MRRIRDGGAALEMRVSFASLVQRFYDNSANSVDVMTIAAA
jgi:hypothetical protein